MRVIPFPDSNEISDPSPELPQEIAHQIKAEITRTVAYLRATEDSELQRIERFGNTALRIFTLLNRPTQAHADVEALRQALRAAAVAAVSTVHFIFRQSGLGSVPFDWHDKLDLRLRHETDRIETEWWIHQAEGNPIQPMSPPPVLTRAPRTETALKVEAYLDKVYRDTDVKVDKTDFWLRPVKPDGTSRYSSDTEFRAFQREDPTLSRAVANTFNSTFKMPSEKFIEGRDSRRQKLQSRRQKKTPR
jgi:hypothetical protein